jgi:hypothetical protein
VQGVTAAVTALQGVGLNLRCEFGVVICVTVGCTTIGDVPSFGTLRRETVICTLIGVKLSTISTLGGGSVGIVGW